MQMAEVSSNVRRLPVPRTANDYVQYALALMQENLYFPAACVLRLLYPNLDAADQPKIADLLVRCGVALHDRELMQYCSKLEGGVQKELAAFMLNSALHERMRVEFRKAADGACVAGRFEHEECVVVCAGGDKLVRQLYCNLSSLSRCWARGGREPVPVVPVVPEPVPEPVPVVPVVVAHAREIDLPLQRLLRAEFADLDLHFVDLAEQPGLDHLDLRGFQIKLAAVACVSAKRVLLMDADLLWVNDPVPMVSDIKRGGFGAHLFCDFWHFNLRRHEKSSSTSFLYSLHEVDFDRLEFESGLVYLDRERAFRSVAILRHMLLHYKYYFSLTFGDKDLFHLALQTQGVPHSTSPLPAMLGTVERGVFSSQSMVQSYREGWASHIHTTLHPVGDDFFATPTHICRDGSKIHFVQRRLGDRTVGTVACHTRDAEDLAAAEASGFGPSFVKLVYRDAKRDYGRIDRLALALT